ncbi:S8 family serine peptidase, partial [Porticoccaceae bacterium]|nr:S8 family serine peptidase [Porticoccaceae bacterium]
TDDDGDGVADTSDDYPLNANVHTAPTASSASYFINLLPKTTNSAGATLASTSQGSRAVTYSIASNTTNGTVTLTNSSTGTFSYSTTQTDAAEDYFTFKVNDGFVDSATSRVDISLKTDPLYKYQWHLDNTGQTSFASNGGTSGADLNIDTAIASGKTGEGVVVAIVDTGLEIAHEDIADNVVTNGSWNYSNSTTDPTPSGSGSDHGTMVAGIVAAKGWNNIGGRGVAPNASIRAFNLIATGNDSYSNEAGALGADNDRAADVSVFNMSYGRGLGTPSNTALAYANTTVQAALTAGTSDLRGSKGALYVNSVGNQYYNGDTGTGLFSYCGDGVNAGTYKIGCYDAVFDSVFVTPYVIGVGALDADNIKAKYSTPGAATWISAFGGDSGRDSTYGAYVYANSSVALPNKPAITTIDRSSCSKGANSSSGSRKNTFNDYQNPHSENANCNYTNTMNGTSSAAPMVSGIIALMLEANSALTWRDVKHILATTAIQVDSSFSATALQSISYVGWVTNSTGLKFHPWYGFGGVDATAAVNAASSYTAGSLDSYSFTNWNLSSAGSVSLGEGVLNTQTLTESGSGTVEHVLVALKVSHSDPTHLGFRLESPDGTISTLLPPLTALGTDFSSSSWIYLPSNAFYGESKAGDWKLYTYDHYAGSTGTLVQWGLQFMHR